MNTVTQFEVSCYVAPLRSDSLTIVYSHHFFGRKLSSGSVCSRKCFFFSLPAPSLMSLGPFLLALRPLFPSFNHPSVVPQLFLHFPCLVSLFCFAATLMRCFLHLFFLSHARPLPLFGLAVFLYFYCFFSPLVALSSSGIRHLLCLSVFFIAVLSL